MPERSVTESLSDQELVAATQAGDRAAFEVLVERHRTQVYGLTLHFLRDAEEADEAAQEAFVRGFQLLDRYDKAREFGPWLRGIAAKVCAEMRRKRRHVSDDEGAPQVAPSRTDATDTALVVQEALESLPDKYRLPLIMFYLDEASVIDVAYALGLSPGGVRVRLHRGRAMLREKLGLTFEQKEVAGDGLQAGTTAC